MPNEIKLSCNQCYQPLEVVEYSNGVYVNPCECQNEEDYELGKEEGFETGFELGKESGYDDGIYEGERIARQDLTQELRQEFEDKFEELHSRFKKLQIQHQELKEEMNEDEEYFDRIGTDS